MSEADLRKTGRPRSVRRTRGLPSGQSRSQDHEGQPFWPGIVMPPLDTRRTPLREVGHIVP